MKARTYANQRQDYVGADGARTLVSSIRNTEFVTATRVINKLPTHSVISTAVEEAFAISVQLRDVTADLFADGKKTGPWGRAQTFTFYDFRVPFVGELHSAFDCVGFHIPRTVMSLIEEDIGGLRIDTLRVSAGSDINDATIYGLTQALLPSFNDPTKASSLFMDTIGLALSIHVATTYGGAPASPGIHPGGLAPWQARRAMEMIDANLDGSLSIFDIASACRLSAGYFARAFKITVGMPPHRWMLVRRNDRAMDLVRNSNLSLGEIAVACGYVDQAHFTRSFAKMIGKAPGNWRKSIRDGYQS